MNAIFKTSPKVDCDVIIVGGGPVGLAAAFLLGRQGLRVELIEKRETTTSLPKGQYVHASSAELYRQWGIIEKIRPQGWPLSRSNGQGLYYSLRDGPVADSLLWHGDEAAFAQWYHGFTPEVPQFVPASVYESALRDRAAQWAGVHLRFGWEVISTDQAQDKVHVLARKGDGTQRQEIQGAYLIAADGVASPIRARLGVAEDVGPDFSQQIVTEFYGPLENYVGNDPYFQYWVLNPACAGWFGSRHPQTGQWRYNFTNPDGRTVTPAEIIERIRGAVGDPGFQVEIAHIAQFRYSTALTRSWRLDRIFFAGDSAHRFAPWGGFGANLGLQEANNLAWKLAAVLKGQAGPALLDTYEQERKSQAAWTLKIATYNTLNTNSLLTASLAVEAPFLETQRVSPTSIAFLKEIFASARASGFAHVGQQFGAVYRSPAIVSDGTEPPVSGIADYRESASPGARAPHFWVTSASGERSSIVDLLRGRLLLLADEEAAAWEQARDALGLAQFLDVHAVGAALQPQSAKWRDLYALEAGGAVLIRPDGFIAARFRQRPTDAQAALGAALDQVLARTCEPAAQAGSASSLCAPHSEVPA